MNLQATTIYRKDFSILLRQLAGAIAVQMFLTALLPYLNRMLTETVKPSGGHGILELNNWEWLFKMQLAVHVMTGLIAAVHFSAEERVGGHDWLLRRLPISLTRIRLEKIAAAASIIGIAIVLQWLITLGIQSFGITYGENAYDTFLILVALGIISYIVGLALSYFFNQSIVIVLLGSLIVFCLVIFVDRLNPAPIILLSILAFLIYAICQIARYSNFISKPQFDLQVEQTKILVYSVLALFALIFITIFFVDELREHWLWSTGIQNTALQASLFNYGITVWYSVLMIASTILTILFGVYTYSSAEKDGLRCLLYHHPISRHQLFWVKYLTGFGFSFLCAIGFMMACEIMLFYSNYLPRENKYAILLLIKSSVLLHFFLYTCGAFATHLNPNPIYAFLETLPLAFITVVYACWLHSDLILNQTLRRFGPFLDSYYMTYPLAVYSLFVLTLGLMFSAWRISTDRDLFTQNIVRRHIYIGRLLLFVFAAVTLIRKTDWSDMLYWITGIEL